MDGRTKLATGGIAAVAVSVAVVYGVALSNRASLADAAGSPVGLSGVVVPSQPAAPAPVPASTPATTPDAAEVVPAPDPQTVVEPEQDSAPSVPVTPVAPAPQAAAPTAAEQQAVIDEASATGQWDRAGEWAESLGWSAQDIDAWLQREEAKYASLTPAHAGIPSDGDRWSRDGSKKERSHDSPNRRD